MNPKILLTGLPLSENTASALTRSAGKLLRHHGVIRVRLDLHEVSARDGKLIHTVKGVVERPGPDLAGSSSAANLYKAVHLLIDLLERRLAGSARAASEKRRRSRIIDFAPALSETA